MRKTIQGILVILCDLRRGAFNLRRWGEEENKGQKDGKVTDKGIQKEGAFLPESLGLEKYQFNPRFGSK